MVEGGYSAGCRKSATWLGNAIYGMGDRGLFIRYLVMCVRLSLSLIASMTGFNRIWHPLLEF